MPRAGAGEDGFAILPKPRHIDLGTEPSFALGGGEVDPRALEYRIAGESIRLQHQTLKVLVALHDHLGQVVTRDELIEHCWGGRIVGDDVINRCVSLLRQVAGRSGRFQIETVPRVGYRLVEAAAEVERRRTSYFRAGAVALVACLVAGVVPWIIHRSAPNYRRILVVAVKGFGAERGSGADGLALEAQESVVRMLAESGLSVKLASSGSGTGDAASDLLVSGFVNTNAHGASATIRVEDVRRHAIILSRRLQSDRLHQGDLPARVGATLASALSWAGPFILRDAQHPSDPAFLAQLLDQASNPNSDELASYAFSRRSSPYAPNSVIAQLALAMITGGAINDLPREQRAGAIATALDAAQRARQLAPDFGDVYDPWCFLHPPVMMRACEDQLRTGLSRDAQAPFVTYFLGGLMNDVGRLEDAHSLGSASLAQDRYVPSKLGLALQLDEAVGSPEAHRIYDDAVRLWPEDKAAFFWLRAQGLLERGDFQALDNFEQGVGKQDFPPDYSSAGMIWKALAARSQVALQKACPRSAQGIQAIECMIASSRLGDLDHAFGFAATLYPPRRAGTPAEENAIWLSQPYVQDTAYLTVPATAAMRSDRRFLVLASDLGLLDYWRSGRMPDFCTKSHEAVCSRIIRR